MVDFSQPYFTTGLGIAVPQRRELEWLPIIRSIMSLRFAEAVGILIGSALIVGALIWLVERRHTDHFRGGTSRIGNRAVVVGLGDDPVGAAGQGAGDAGRGGRWRRCGW